MSGSDNAVSVSTSGAGRLAEFERLYRAEVGVISRYFARRSEDPQTVADLTADTFVEAMRSFATFDPTKGSSRAWLFAIARRVVARHWESQRRQRDVSRRLGSWVLDDAEVTDELIARIDAERAGRALMERMKHLHAPTVPLLNWWTSSGSPRRRLRQRSAPLPVQFGCGCSVQEHA
jgi:DNA-directed RNA polymerase specialized sigma24 family protein